MDNNEEKILNLDIFTSIIFIGTIIISIFLTYNEKQSKRGKKLIKDITAKKLNITNRVIGFILVLVFLYINYVNYLIAKRKNEDLKNLNLQLVASGLTVISSLIVLYVVINDRATQTSSIENPNV